MFQHMMQTVRLLIDALTEDQLRLKPASDRFSIAEVLAHLAHTERYCYTPRIQSILAEGDAEFVLYNPDEHLEEYSDRSPHDSLEEFDEYRQANAEIVRSLPPSALSRTAQHNTRGIVTLDQQLHEWSYHDLGHVRQIAELVRWLRDWPNMGPFQTGSTIKP
jgi:hypothetical protein